MKRVYFIVLLMGFFALSGCVTTKPPVSSETTAAPVVQEYQAKINSLENELNRAKDENYSLRKQLEAAGKREVRMPNGTEIQAALKKAGLFKGEIDGKIGPETKEAIRKFQQGNGMTPDGVVGSKTWVLLSKYLNN
jgi:peptidoglycan hydrolase-like protein with peptidoglycan-binding domain